MATLAQNDSGTAGSSGDGELTSYRLRRDTQTKVIRVHTLEAQTVTSPAGAVFSFDIDPKKKAKMLKGLDAIGETLEAAGDIDTYEMRRALAQPWLEGA